MLGLSDDEAFAIYEELGRSPNETELVMYSVMWSEHCSYKSSRVHLERLPSEAPWVLVGPGENAGVVDIGGEMAAVLRIESHNHPSAVEPFQGAATGVGGIIRDILTMGARPIALADPLRFGPITTGEGHERNRYLTQGVVSGISAYGNAVGVPTVAGEVDFAPCWSGNPLVNVFCLGLMPQERLMLARAARPGDLAVLIGASTGRDGIGGVSILASSGFSGDESGTDKRPNVQVGDPFEEKKLIEACLEMFEAGVVEGIQDLGGAGLTCASSEIAANSGKGMVIDVARVPRREPGMTPAEVMASESQERMLAIVAEANLHRVFEICDKWDVTASVVGMVVEGTRLRVVDSGQSESAESPEGLPTGRLPEASKRVARSPLDPDFPSGLEVIADVPASSLAKGPKYERPMRPRDSGPSPPDLPPSPELEGDLLDLLADPSIADSSWIWRQYDHELFLNTVAGPGGDATLLRIKETGGALALSCDGSPRFSFLDPRMGAKLLVAESARNVATTGARPIALVDCLNFGNPEHPVVMWELSETVDGIAEACEALGIPVVGGNVSLYNESAGADIWPTPVVATLGLVRHLKAKPPGPAFSADGDDVWVIGETRAELGGSAWEWTIHDRVAGVPPSIDLEHESELISLVARLASLGVSALHDCSSGGLGVAIAEAAIQGERGLSADLDLAPVATDSIEPHQLLFSETSGRVVVAAENRLRSLIGEMTTAAGISARVIGETGGGRIDLGIVSVDLAEAVSAWREGLPRAITA